MLTRSQYQAIQGDTNWNYWRESMAAVFRMQPIVMIGLSLSDPHIKHILQAAKEGAGVNQPICWIAPDIDFSLAQDLLYKYRVRVIPYDNRDGTHTNLVRLIENIGQFVFPRTSVKIQKEIEGVTQSPLGQRASAPGFFVFNKIAAQSNYEEYRVNIMCAAIKAIVPSLPRTDAFSLQDALILAGLPNDFSLDKTFSNAITEQLVLQGILSRSNDKFVLGSGAEDYIQKELKQYDHARKLFLETLKNRIQRNYTNLPPSKAQEIAEDIEKSLVGFFRQCGLTLSTTLLDPVSITKSPIPSSVIKFINQAAAKYDDILSRQVFSTSAIDIFTQPEVAEKEYLLNFKDLISENVP